MARPAGLCLAFLLLNLLVTSCKSNDAPIDEATPDNGALKACLDRPSELPRPPVGRLPCELIPPGLSL